MLTAGAAGPILASLGTSAATANIVVNATSIALQAAIGSRKGGAKGALAGAINGTLQALSGGLADKASKAQFAAQYGKLGKEVVEFAAENPALTKLITATNVSYDKKNGWGVKVNATGAIKSVLGLPAGVKPEKFTMSQFLGTNITDFSIGNTGRTGLTLSAGLNTPIGNVGFNYSQNLNSKDIFGRGGKETIGGSIDVDNYEGVGMNLGVTLNYDNQEGLSTDFELGFTNNPLLQSLGLNVNIGRSGAQGSVTQNGGTMGTVDTEGNYEANENFLGEINGHDIAENVESINRQGESDGDSNNNDDRQDNGYDGILPAMLAGGTALLTAAASAFAGNPTQPNRGNNAGNANNAGQVNNPMPIRRREDSDGDGERQSDRGDGDGVGVGENFVDNRIVDPTGPVYDNGMPITSPGGFNSSDIDRNNDLANDGDGRIDNSTDNNLSNSNGFSERTDIQLAQATNPTNNNSSGATIPLEHKAKYADDSTNGGITRYSKVKDADRQKQIDNKKRIDDEIRKSGIEPNVNDARYWKKYIELQSKGKIKVFDENNKMKEVDGKGQQVFFIKDGFEGFLPDKKVNNEFVFESVNNEGEVIKYTKKVETDFSNGDKVKLVNFLDVGRNVYKATDAIVVFDTDGKLLIAKNVLNGYGPKSQNDPFDKYPWDGKLVKAPNPAEGGYTYNGYSVLDVGESSTTGKDKKDLPVDIHAFLGTNGCYQISPLNNAGSLDNTQDESKNYSNFSAKELYPYEEANEVIFKNKKKIIIPKRKILGRIRVIKNEIQK